MFKFKQTFERNTVYDDKSAPKPIYLSKLISRSVFGNAIKTYRTYIILAILLILVFYLYPLIKTRFPLYMEEYGKGIINVIALFTVIAIITHAYSVTFTKKKKKTTKTIVVEK